MKNKHEDFIQFLEVNFATDIEIKDNSLDTESAFWDEIKMKLKLIIKHLLRTNHQRLLDILYRIDVSEKIVSRAFSLGNEELISQELALCIIERQIKKVKYRQTL